MALSSTLFNIVMADLEEEIEMVSRLPVQGSDTWLGTRKRIKTIS